MNTITFNFIISMLLLSVVTFSNASYASNTLDISSYNKELKQAIRLYKDNDFEQALPQLELFAKRGDKMSQYMVGTMYLNAQGTQQDLLKSYAWLTVANEQKSEVWERPLIMLQEKLPKDFLVKLVAEGNEYLALYGAKSQRLKCKNVKELGSKKPTYRCKKMEVKNGYYFVDDQQSITSID
ncbi:sel1 repeat family protein [Colwellia sp. 6M3]|uniref:sel1 repeat family protein n=1 Tax=Colwellia sp. 6M3 TaxID=2759849 RepID=UPI0015F55ADB|nr:sel1 repeat family protein [Colwellia sp. 6M3]MBA6416273.1 sel1 repeat family protein [Colwellia sp. 6M3]|tara:strand:- start:4046 stop:4591 length:546 start_codon:yes stop_codon:yes gene_type:complete